MQLGPVDDEARVFQYLGNFTSDPPSLQFFIRRNSGCRLRLFVICAHSPNMNRTGETGQSHFFETCDAMKEEFGRRPLGRPDGQSAADYRSFGCRPDTQAAALSWVGQFRKLSFRRESAYWDGWTS